MIRRWLPVVTLALLIVSDCSSQPPHSGPPRPTSKTIVPCSVSGRGQVQAEFLPGSPKNPVDSLQVTFHDDMPSSDIADVALRSCIEAMRTAVRVDYETLVNAWFNDEGPLDLPDGSSALAFDPKTGTVRTWNEREGVQRQQQTRSGYSVEISERKMAVPPFSPLVTIDLLYAETPSPVTAEKAMVDEIRAAVQHEIRRYKTSAYTHVGPATERNNRKQVRGASGQYLSAAFDPKTGEIRNQDNGLLATIK